MEEQRKKEINLNDHSKVGAYVIGYQDLTTGLCRK